MMFIIGLWSLLSSELMSGAINITKSYRVRTYFQDDVKNKKGYAEYFFQILYNTLIPSFLLLMAVEFKDVRLFSSVLFLLFLVFVFSQFRVSDD